MLVTRYNSNFFNPVSIDHAKKIILMDNDIPDQWESETKWTINFFSEKNLFNKDSIVLDWGCGIGRLAKPIIEKFNCKVVGVDFQPNMLKYATEYVNNSNFTAISNEEFSELPNEYFTVGLSVWALQHTIHTTPIINCIQKKLKFKSKFCVMESNLKHWPVQQVENNIITSDDVIFDVPLLKNDTEKLDAVQWAYAPSHSIGVMLDYFSVEEIISPLSSKKAEDVTLSKYFNDSWSGVFINDKKYLYE